MKGSIKRNKITTKYLKYAGNSSVNIIEYLGDSIFVVECSCCKKNRRNFMGFQLERLAKKISTIFVGSV